MEEAQYKLTIIKNSDKDATIQVTVPEKEKKAIFKAFATPELTHGVFLDADGDSFAINFANTVFIGSEKIQTKTNSTPPRRSDETIKKILNVLDRLEEGNNEY